MKAVLVLNCGSSSIKFQLINPFDETVLVKGLIEKIGETKSFSKFSSEKFSTEVVHENPAISSHAQGVKVLQEYLNQAGYDLKKTPPLAVGHRVVHGGPYLWKPEIVTEDVINKIEKAIDLAPLHNPANVLGIKEFTKFLPETTQIVVFDTGFFHDLPKKSSTYALNREIAEKYFVKRYGAHGTSHEYVMHKLEELTKKPKVNAIILHIGNGASVSLIENSKPVETSMGLTPLEGLVMGTRTGDIDPASPMYLQRMTGKSPEQIDHIMNYQSGLLGLTGSNDFRDVITKANSGDKLCQEGLDIYVHRICKYIGSYRVLVNNLDAIVFTAGVGENSDWLRAKVFENIYGLGIKISPELNSAKSSEPRIISSEDSAIPIWVIPTNEELAIAQLSEKLVT